MGGGGGSSVWSLGDDGLGWVGQILAGNPGDQGTVLELILEIFSS